METNSFFELLRSFTQLTSLQFTQLTSLQLERAQEHLRHHLQQDLLRQALAEHHLAPPTCPYCHAQHVIHWGQSRGLLRYRCKECGKTFNQLHGAALARLRTFGTPAWHDSLAAYLAERETLVARYAKEREQNRIPVEIAPGQQITLSPGEHSELIRAIIEDFAPRFAPGSVLVYAGDTGDKWGYFDAALLAGLGVDVDSHGKMPDVVLHFVEKNWLLLVESVTSHGPVDGKRHAELAKLFAGSKAGLVYVTAFPNRSIMGRYLGEIAWETEVWVADAPSHLIHFNGVRFLGPYPTE